MFKEIQDHLLGEISETDNSVKSLYEARKIESKLEQRKLLGIVTPGHLVDINAIRHGKSEFYSINFVASLVIKENVLLMVKLATSVVVRTTLKPNILRSSRRARELDLKRIDASTVVLNLNISMWLNVNVRINPTKWKDSLNKSNLCSTSKVH